MSGLFDNCLDAAKAREIWRYDQETGELFWRVRRGTAREGAVAGTPSGNGYLLVRFGGRLYKVHRVIWLIVTGAWPANQIDHLNGKRSDNRIANLSDKTGTQNMWNRQRANRNSKSGLLGVSKDRNRWQARIMAYGKQRHLGMFGTKEEAHDAYLAAKAERDSRGEAA